VRTARLLVVRGVVLVGERAGRLRVAAVRTAQRRFAYSSYADLLDQVEFGQEIRAPPERLAGNELAAFTEAVEWART
jgi:hypothetical protein